jgi:hypothetical protein
MSSIYEIRHGTNFTPIQDPPPNYCTLCAVSYLSLRSSQDEDLARAAAPRADRIDIVTPSAAASPVPTPYWYAPTAASSGPHPDAASVSLHWGADSMVRRSAASPQ